MVLTAIDEKVASPASSMPAMATITVAPEISTACPEVPAATRNALARSRPAATSSRSRRR